ncbi:MAG: hypothetical protein ACKVQB_12925, partial [Bacteroidia bacterium]
MSDLTLSAQADKDSIQKILTGTEAQIKYYSKNHSLFTTAAMNSITYHLEILKSVSAYKYEAKSYYRKVKHLDSCFTVL